MPEANKVVFNDVVVIDLTADTITPADLRLGITAHAADGTVITGTKPDYPNLDNRSF